eukprot:13501506-Alexandrium_andersonii.AAC.1
MSAAPALLMQASMNRSSRLLSASLIAAYVQAVLSLWRSADLPGKAPEEQRTSAGATPVRRWRECARSDADA